MKIKSIKAEILTIGDELLYGQTLDTNSHWLSGELDQLGVRVNKRTTVGDNEEDILEALTRAESSADIILITGGLGPTSDDLTKPCLAKFFGCEIAIHPEALEEVTQFFKQRGRELTELNRQQAALPVCCEKITNTMGTAPGMWFYKNGKVFVSMPGVPFEMRNMITTIVIPKLREKFLFPTIHHQMIRTVGIGESFLAEKISSWETALPPRVKLAYLPGVGGVKLRLTSTGENRAELKKETDKLLHDLTPLIGKYVYAESDDSLETYLGEILNQKKLTLSVAESCTGGYVSHLITSISGSSRYYKGGVVAYDNQVKINLLNVKQETLEKYGAVSEEVVKEMAMNVRKILNTSIGIATSGIAGPDGGTSDKPVGTICIAFSDEKKTITKKLQLAKDRITNIQLTSTLVMDLIRKNLDQ